MVTKKKSLTHSRYKEADNRYANTKKSGSRNVSISKNLDSKLKSGVENDLFICVTDVINKRKSLLNSLKIALLAQEECEVVHNLRSQKYTRIETLKKEINQVNNLYIKLQKLFPNTKHVISHAEKELNELDHQISLLNQSREIEEKELNELESAHDNVLDISDSLDKREEEIRASSRSNNLSMDSQYNKNSKLGRIQNNLKIIEQKLKYLD